MILAHITHIADICAKSGIKEAILSPGSRCAPISLAFIRHPDIHCRTVSDERSAAFIALGMAQQLEKPVVLICTSGSAALNYAPAVAEAFFQQIPLLILTADRPAEWIDQWDGQTIRQEQLYGKHVKGSLMFPDEGSIKEKIWHARRLINEALVLSKTFPMGPVHVNIPVREPFYPLPEEEFTFPMDGQVLETIPVQHHLKEEVLIKLKSKLESYQKIMVVPGQQRPNPQVQKLLDELVRGHKAVVIADAISNLQSSSTVTHHDLILQNPASSEILEPDLVISFGKSIISKALKLFLRNAEVSHWHIQPQGYVPDSFQHLTKIIPTSPDYFLEFLLKNGPEIHPPFEKSWGDNERKVRKVLPEILENTAFGEFKALYKIRPFIPKISKIHLANSMPVRYVNFLGLGDGGQEIICNRGTSGIDGSNSAAVGCTFTTKEPVTLITGDMAFFYDRNAFWHKYNMANLRVIVLNNHGGGIFRLIEGPSKLPELDEYFETQQRLEADLLAQEAGFDYLRLDQENNLPEVLDNFYHKSVRPKILEIISSSVENATVLQEVKKAVKQLLSK
ncbi:2-succinyl-5-enolpyruvyl-6-hydroxy-3-cyclohexene-1-carboxylic-acid synthase [Negadavirga shengliensis]|uniref:2-succinyl-5-enolpyruvyl-6-hydroxy-3-cyclohexene-1-carboxylate synthase n=1 Tax=Negadavirga shengliensis TaxID=1389218 RepID=A0ABV9T2R9_9BACT